MEKNDNLHNRKMWNVVLNASYIDIDVDGYDRRSWKGQLFAYNVEHVENVGFYFFNIRNIVVDGQG